MQVNVVCPNCNSQYQLGREMIGQKIRCPNASCRQVFEVREAPAERPKPPKPKPPVRDRRAPTFEGGDAPRHGATESGPREAEWSAMPPPPVRRRETVATEAEASAAPAEQASPEEVLAWMSAAPASAPADVNGDIAIPAGEVIGDYGAAETSEATYETAGDDAYAHYYPRPRRRWMRMLVVVMFFLIFAGGITFLFIKKGQWEQREGILKTEAEAMFADVKYSQSQKKFEELHKDFEKSKDRNRYKFMGELAGQLATAHNNSETPAKRRADLEKFYIGAQDEEFTKAIIEEHQTAVWDAFDKLLNEQSTLAQRAIDAKDFDGARSALDEAERMAAYIDRRGSKDVKDRVAAVRDKLAQFAVQIKEDRAYAVFISRLEEAFKSLTPAIVAEYEGQAKAQGYQNRPQVLDAITKAKEDLKKQIKFTSDERARQSPPKSDLPLILVGAARSSPTAATERVVFAVARGVLYALAEGTGHVLWTTRVGIDVSSVPLRIPKTGGNAPELVLVPTADGKGLVARDVQTGKAIWLQTLEAPMRGRPILAERRLLVPLADDTGTVALIETFDGSRLGFIKLNQKLGPGGAWQAGTSRVFIAADSQNVFVLDINPKPGPTGVAAPVELMAVLQTGHGGGTLRSEPLVLGTIDENGMPLSPNFLVLTQSDGLSDMKVRAFELALPLAALGAPVDIRLPGWSWFAPTSDLEKLALATDAGVFALFGVAQKGAEDKPLFPLVITEPTKGADRLAGRSQIVFADDRNFWHLANGELSMSRFGFDRKEGQRVAPGWKQSLKVGTPLHAGQINAERDVLFVVTQTASPPGCFATAVEAHTGAVRWQRALGLSPQGDAVRVGKFIYQLDQGGGLYAVEASQIKVDPNEDWAATGVMLAPARTDLVGKPDLLRAADGQSVYAIMTVRETGGTHKLLVRHIVPDQPPQELPAVALGKETIAGPPTLVGAMLYLPLSSGKLSRLALGTANLVGGPDWKAAAASDDTRGYVLPMAGDELLVSNGQRGLSVFAWPATGAFQFKRQSTLNNRISAAPLRLPAEKGAPRIVIADSGGQILMLDGDTLAPILTWNVRQMQLGSDVTAGPYLIGEGPTARLLAVVDRTHLVCLAADSRLPLWKYRVKGDGLAGVPQLIGTVLVLADLSGRYEALDAATGAPLGGAFPPAGVLPAAPAAAPVDLGDGRLFAPLTDGTTLLVPRDAIAPKK